jgi:hypothetical protein
MIRSSLLPSSYTRGGNPPARRSGGFAIVPSNVVWRSKMLWEMGVVHGASERLWTRPLRTKVVPFVIVIAPVTRVLRAIITWVMLPVGLRFRQGTRSVQVVASRKFYR